MNVFVLKNTKEDILKNMGNRAVLGHSIFFPTMEVNGAPKQPDYKLSSNIFVCVPSKIYSSSTAICCSTLCQVEEEAARLASLPAWRRDIMKKKMDEDK